MTSWFVRVSDGVVCGPFREIQIRRGFETGKIADTMQIRQGKSPWTDAKTVKLLFQQLADQGFYLKNELNEVYGPFTKNRVLELDSAGQLPAAYWIRHRSDGPWTPIHSPESNSVLSDDLQNKKAELRPYVPAAPVMKLRSRSWIKVFFSSR